MKFNFFQKGTAVTAATVLIVPLLTPSRSDGLIPVFDAGSYAMIAKVWSQDISTYSKMVATVVNLEKIYASGVQMYNLGTAMSQSFSGQQKADWLAVAQLGVADFTHDQYGENKTWGPALSGNPAAVPNAWQMSTVALNAGLSFQGETVGHSPMLSRLASMEALDGSSTKCLQTISAYRGNSLANQLGPYLKWAIAHADGTAATNSQIEQLNLMNGALGQQRDLAKAQGDIQSCLVEQQILANKKDRDAIAENLNFVGATQGYAQTENPFWGGSAATLSSYFPQ